MDITKQDRQVFVPISIDLIQTGLGSGFALILTNKTALIFHGRSIDKIEQDL